MALTLSGTNGVVGAGFTLDPSGASVTAGVGTFSSARVGAAVTISESGIEASGIGITCANINGAQIGGRRNLIINGAMQVAQRGTSSTSSGYGTVDRFMQLPAGTDEAPTFSQADVASGTTPYTLGFRKSFKIQNGNQTSGAGASDRIRFQYTVEAQDIANSGWNYTSASSFITFSFWVKSSVAQNFYGRLYSFDGTNYAYSFETGSLTADTWTKVVLKIPGNSNLQFDNNNDSGLMISIGQYIGSDYTTSGHSLDTWAAWNSSSRYPDFTSTWYETNDATWEITGIQLEVGSQATAFEHRSFGEELSLCQRYFVSKNVCLGTAYNGEGGNVTATARVDFNPTMRADPTITFPTNHSATNTNSDLTSGISKDGFSYGANIVSSGNYFRQSTMQATAEL